MKKTFYLLGIVLALFLLNCNGQTGKSTADSKNAQPVATAQTLPGDNSEPVHIDKAQFLKLIMNYEKNPATWVFEGDKPCVIDFYADWCAPCRITSPILDDLAEQYAGKINVYKVDIDEEQELAAVFGVQSIPTFLFCPLEGKPTMSSGIANSPAATKEMFIRQIEELLLKKTDSSSAI